MQKTLSLKHVYGQVIILAVPLIEKYLILNAITLSIAGPPLAPFMIYEFMLVSLIT